jgi:ubiquinone/menaquinone biosynthesis C-methylase UbiE
LSGSVAVRDHKDAAVRQWTADPCGADATGGDPGSAEYLARLDDARRAYAPWMDEVLKYETWAGKDVLDVGCGQGIDVARYAAGGASATGVDLTERHLELARRLLEHRGLEARLVQGDAEGLPFADASFDGASSNGVLHHTPDMLAALREIRRVLRPGGRATVIVYNRDSLHYWLHQFALHGILLGKLLRERSMEGVMSRTVERSSVGARPLVRVHSRGQLRAAMEEAGFADVRTAVRHFHAEDTLPTRLASKVVPALRDPSVLDRIGRRAGWYVIATGTRPSE